MAIKKELFSKGNLLLLSCNSNDPSNTMSIKPNVPSMGKMLEKSGSVTSKKVQSCWVVQPKSNNRITEGIFVIDADKSKIYATNKRIQIVDINNVVIK